MESANLVRVMLRLHGFQYLDSTLPKRVWYLFNTNRFQTISDISADILKRFCPKFVYDCVPADVICLYVQKHLVPPWESVLILRENDVIRVTYCGGLQNEKFLSLKRKDTHSNQTIGNQQETAANLQVKKRKKEKYDEGQELSVENGGKAEKKKKKKSKKEKDTVIIEGVANSQSETDIGCKNSELHITVNGCPRETQSEDTNDCLMEKLTSSFQAPTASMEEQKDETVGDEEDSHVVDTCAVVIKDTETNNASLSNSAECSSICETEIGDTKSDDNNKTVKRKKHRRQTKRTRRKYNCWDEKTYENNTLSTDTTVKNLYAPVEYVSLNDPDIVSIKSTGKKHINFESDEEHNDCDVSSVCQDEQSADPVFTKPKENVVNVTFSSSGNLEVRSLESKRRSRMNRGSEFYYDYEQSDSTVSVRESNGNESTYTDKTPGSGSPVIVADLISSKSQRNLKANKEFKLVADAQIFNRRKHKRKGSFPMSYAEDISGQDRYSNKSFVFQNECISVSSEETENASSMEEPTTKGSPNKNVEKPPMPSKNYAELEPLLGAPRVGDLIAYKVLEVSTSYTPELSDYKEGKVLQLNPATKSITIELTACKDNKVNGRFHMEDSDEYVIGDHDYVGKQVDVLLSSLVEPKLIN